MTAPTRGPRLHTGLIALRTAQQFIGRYHRHNKPPTGHNTSLGVWIAGTDQLVGVAVIGRPVSRHLDLPMRNGRWRFREVTRTCTDGTRNANSALYGACKRQWQAWGNVDHLTTTLLDNEPGISPRAAGWVPVYTRPPNKGWSRPGRERGDTHPTGVGHTVWTAVGGWRYETDDVCYETKPTCVACGHPIARAATGRPAHYCNPACRQRAYRRRRDTPTPDVPAPFTTPDGLWVAP